jgi:class 3 adenylate cyclase/tetratricopeptide (TPR) repeat protein
VSVVFADVANSTELAERLDPESLHEILDRYSAACASAVERHGGRVEKFIGDAVVGMFGLPTLHEDDALRAVQAAFDVRRAVKELSETLTHERGVELDVSIGVNTGEVFAGQGLRQEPFPAGDAIYVAARLQQTAQAGEILLGDETQRLVGRAARTEALGPISVKGRAAPVRTWRLLAFPAPDDAAAQPAPAPFVGRSGELDELRQLLTAVREGPACRLCTVVGPPGIGKSRLLRELLQDVGDDVTSIVGRCLPYGEGVTYRPLADIVRHLANGDPRSRILELLRGDERADLVARRIVGAIGPSAEAARPEETSWAVRRLFEALAHDRPLIAVFEDLHWAEPTLLDLLEYVAAFSSGYPILLLCPARPELLEARPTWAAQPSSRILALEPLPSTYASELALLLGAEHLQAPVLARIVDRAEGNPLFLEQLVAVQREHGQVALPPSIRAVLAARIDALEPGERLLLEHASVEGRSFHRGALLELIPEDEHPDVGANLRSLASRQLIRPDASVVAGDDAFRFAHALVREAAYEGLPKRLRGELHERVARWLAKRDRRDEIVGYHLEQAARFWRELGLVGARERGIARQAAKHLEAAARAALLRGDLPAGSALLDRAAAVLPVDDPSRAALLPRLGAALFEAGRLADAGRVLSEAIENAGDNRLLEARSRVEREFVGLHREPSAQAIHQARRVVDSALPLFEEVADDLGQSRVWCLRAMIDWLEGQAARADEAWARAAAQAERAGEEWELFWILGWRASAALYGPTPVRAAIERCRAICERVHSSPVAVAVTLHPLAALHAMLGDFDEARSLLDEGNRILEELGRMQTAHGHHEAFVEMLAGHPENAERILRRGYRKLEEMGEKTLLSTTAAMLAQAAYAQGRLEEAEQFCAVSEETAAGDDLTTQVVWRCVRGKILAGQGRGKAGAALAREAISLVERTDLLTDRGDALLDLVEVLNLAQTRAPEETERLVLEALALYERKGNIVSATHARSLLAAQASW